MCRSYILDTALVWLSILSTVDGTVLLVLNHGQKDATFASKQVGRKLVEPGGFFETKLDNGNEKARHVSIDKVHKLVVPSGRYAIIRVDAVSSVTMHDNNAVQLELSAAGHKCLSQVDDGQSSLWTDCLATHAFGGMPNEFALNSWHALWESYEYWHLCNVAQPPSVKRSQMTEDGFRVDILRETPLVATVRNFVSKDVCTKLMQHANKDSLVRAHIGSGGGETTTSESRETLTTNFFVNWKEKSALSYTAARSFDLVSQLLGVNVSYEGQEPINFLHYLSGFEYRPHMDGSIDNEGKRVATTLVYCEAAHTGGATVFPSGSDPLRYQPGDGDLLFFKYMPDPRLAEHAACPVISGLKTTLTQWYRLGVSRNKNWDLFENWGRFHNPYMASRWAGPRYDPKTLAFEARSLGYMESESESDSRMTDSEEL